MKDERTFNPQFLMESIKTLKNEQVLNRDNVRIVSWNNSTTKMPHGIIIFEGAYDWGWVANAAAEGAVSGLAGFAITEHLFGNNKTDFQKLQRETVAAVERIVRQEIATDRKRELEGKLDSLTVLLNFYHN